MERVSAGVSLRSTSSFLDMLEVASVLCSCQIASLKYRFLPAFFWRIMNQKIG
jgi:hypothetical protein